MKKVMTRAWEIARLAVKHHGGKASEYIAGSLKMAWEEYRIANIEQDGVGFYKVSAINGTIRFITNNIDGLKVSFLTEKFNYNTGKKEPVYYDITDKHNVVNTHNGRKFRMYQINVWGGDVKMELNGETVIMPNNNPHKNIAA